MKKALTAVVLAAGIGKRFWPFTTDKSIFPMLGEPIIFRTITKLSEVGFTRIVIVTNTVNDAEIRGLHFPSIEIFTVVQKTPGGMGEALLAANPLIAGHPILIVNAEDVVEDTLYEMVSKEIKKGDAYVAAKQVDEYFDGGYLQMSQNKLLKIIEKPGAGKEPSNLINLVFHFFPNADHLIERISSVTTSRDDQYERALDQYAKAFPVSVIAYDGFWSPIKYPWHVLDVHEYLLKENLKPGKGRGVQIRNNVSIEGSVYIGNNVRIFENTKIVGPAYIGDNSIIGNNNIIRESYIGENCVTGFNTDITRSYIGAGCWFHSNYIGDSILEGNVSMGSGSVLANLRLDEGKIFSSVRDIKMPTHRTKLGAMIGKDVRIGVNTSIMPGIKVGSNSCIGAGIVLDTDLPENSFCTAKVSYEIKKNTKKIGSDRGTFKAKL